ncbi:MAG: GreA/GreB family elongation factor [Acidobacteriota bacterium]
MTQKIDRSQENAVQKLIEKHLAAGELDAIEEGWMARMEQDPKDLAYFAPAAKSLGKAGENDTARFLLELLDEQLTDQGEWLSRLELLQRTGHLLLETNRIHPTIVSTLNKLYSDLPSYKEMAEKVGLHRAIDDLPKTWKKVQRLTGLLDFDVGSIVRMDGKGAGRVTEVNMALESFKVSFENDIELRVGFGGAIKLLKPLEPGHVLYRKLMEPEALIELRDKSPGELLHLVFESYDEPLTGAQIKRILAGIVAEKKWSSWWTGARKHPQVIAAPGGKRAYVWAASSEDAQGAVWASFQKADPRGQMDLLRRDGARDAGLKSRMSKVLAERAAENVTSDPGLACEIWFNLERHGELPESKDGSPRVLITELEDPRPLFAGIQARPYRERAYELTREHRQDWPEIFSQVLLQEPDAHALDILAKALEEEASERVESFVDQIVSQPRKNPGAFVWFAERAAQRQDWLARNPIRFLKQLLWVFTDEAFASFRAARLMPMAESGGTLPRLIPHLNEAQAEDAVAALERTAGLESYQRKPLITAVHLRFPSLRQESEAPLYATQPSIDTKRAELKELLEVEIPANRRAIEEARELGDLSENFEYKSARQRHEYLAARAAALNHDLSRARPIDAGNVKGGEVVIGSKVELAADDSNRTITILGPWESEPEKDVLSSESEIAQKLLGTKVGDAIELAGVNYRVDQIGPYE